MADKTAASSSGIGVLGMLGVLFVGLKLTGFIDWSWWWVTAPFWGGLALVAAILALFGVAYLVCAGIDAMAARKRKARR